MDKLIVMSCTRDLAKECGFVVVSEGTYKILLDKEKELAKLKQESIGKTLIDNDELRGENCTKESDYDKIWIGLHDIVHRRESCDVHKIHENIIDILKHYKSYLSSEYTGGKNGYRN